MISICDCTNHARQDCNFTQGLGLGLPRQQTVTNFNTHTTRSLPSLMQFLHACAGFPTVATWTKAMDAGHHIGWPGLLTSGVRKCSPDSEETAMGHQKLVRQGIYSAQKADSPLTSKGEPTEQDGATSKGDQRQTARSIGRHLQCHRMQPIRRRFERHHGH